MINLKTNLLIIPKFVTYPLIALINKNLPNLRYWDVNWSPSIWMVNQPPSISLNLPMYKFIPCVVCKRFGHYFCIVPLGLKFSKKILIYLLYAFPSKHKNVICLHAALQKCMPCAHYLYSLTHRVHVQFW